MEISLGAIGKARAVLIAGPTASGKSAAALRLAEEAARQGRAAWIVNADAMQVYDALRVVTARPTAADERARRIASTGMSRRRRAIPSAPGLPTRRRLLKEAARPARSRSLTGGTGLYFKALTEGLADSPVPRETRARMGVAASRGGRRASPCAPCRARSFIGRDDPSERSAAHPARA